LYRKGDKSSVAVDLVFVTLCLAEAIARQFADWGLSRSESEVGRLLLKGLSIREIAAVRNTQEKTVRAQASSLYKKASLEGRHAFAAWFLEDID